MSAPARRSTSLALAILAAFAAGPAPRAEDWPTFRGPGRTAVAPDTDLLETWPPEGPKLVWESAGVGRGYAGLAIAGGRIYTLGDGLSTADDGDEYLACFDAKTGAPAWKTKTGKPWNSGSESWQSSRSTPSVDGDTVYVLSPYGVLLACDTNTGTEKWQLALKPDFAGKKGDGWGYSESVTIDGDQLVFTPGGTKATMAAVNKKTGQRLWICPVPEDRGAGHSSIVIATVKGRKVYVQTTASGALGVEAESGKLLWNYPIDQTTAVIPTPIVRDDLVFFSAGYGRGGALLRQVPNAAGGIDIEPVYGLNRDLANKHGGIVVVGDHLYGASEESPILFCAELMTGKIVWKKRGSGKGSAAIVAADGHLYVRYADGTLALVKADPAAYQEVAAFKIPGSGDRPSWSHATILDGRLYLREGDKLLCYDIRAGR
ncbi:MAG: PQQ-binding-like beta-propeller repeat protein [Planctomycetia bacterium]|jgi:outer membrane protein assembly factor BamB